MRRSFCAVAAAAAVSGCAGVEFSDAPTPNSLKFYETVPALLFTTNEKCALIGQIVSLPGKPKYVSYHSGLGKSVSKLSFGPGGVVTGVDVTSEGQVEDAIKIATALGIVGLTNAEQPANCQPQARLFPITVDGLGNSRVELERDLLAGLTR